MRKKLLSEAQVRRFQSLASIKPLNEMDSSYKKHDDEDKMEEMAYKKHDDEDKMEEAYDEAAMKDDEAHMKDDMMEEEDMDMGADEDADEGGDSDVELDEELVEKFMEAAATIQELSDALGGKAGGDMDMDDDMDMDMDMDMGGDDSAPAPEAEASPGGEKDEEEMLEEALHGINYIPSQKEVVKIVAKRVARRLQEAKRAEARLNRALGKRR